MTQEYLSPSMGDDSQKLSHRRSSLCNLWVEGNLNSGALLSFPRLISLSLPSSLPPSPLLPSSSLKEGTDPEEGDSHASLQRSDVLLGEEASVQVKTTQGPESQEGGIMGKGRGDDKWWP